jgi:hypothetical protein
MPNSKDPVQTEPSTPGRPDPDSHKERGQRSILRLPEKRRDENMRQRSAPGPDTEKARTHAKSS